MGGSNAALEKRVDDLINENKIMVFSKSYCPYCKMAKNVLKELNVNYEVIELDNDKDGSAIQQILGKKTGATSVPRVFIRQKCIGGGTETKKLHEQGKLKELIEGTA